MRGRPVISVLRHPSFNLPVISFVPSVPWSSGYSLYNLSYSYILVNMFYYFLHRLYPVPSARK
jgi:hypothetical protein